MPFSKEEKAYILANCEKKTIRELEKELKQKNNSLIGDIYSKLLSFLKRKNNNFKREKRKLYINNKLSDRETQILELMANGLSDKEIAQELCIAETTVRTHANSIFEQLCLHGSPKHTIRVKAVIWYIENIKKINLGGNYEKR